MNKRRMFLLSGICLLVVGAALCLPALQQYRGTLATPRVSASPFSGQQQPPIQLPSDAYKEGLPVRVQVPSLDIDLAVAEGHFDTKTKQWTLSNEKAHYAVKTPKPNNAAGNTFIYGHNKPGVLKALAKIKQGAEVVIVTDTGSQFVYRFAGAYETHPDDDSLFNYQGKPMLTIQTCSGMWYQNRQLFTFDLQEIR
jgi:sortase (surface protein transpeptidase)